MADEIILAAELLTCDRLTDILRQQGVLREARVTEISHQPIGDGMLGENVRFTVTYDHEEECAPRTLAGKFPSLDQAVRENYDGPLSMATDMMVWNITRDGVTERMAVSPDRTWDVDGPGEELAPDPTRASEYTQYILDGRLDVDEANAHWVKEFMARTGLTEEDLKAGG